jgi:hypothetical protein
MAVAGCEVAATHRVAGAEVLGMPGPLSMPGMTATPTPQLECVSAVSRTAQSTEDQSTFESAEMPGGRGGAALVADCGGWVGAAGVTPQGHRPLKEGQ